LMDGYCVLLCRSVCHVRHAAQRRIVTDRHLACCRRAGQIGGTRRCSCARRATGADRHAIAVLRACAAADRNGIRRAICHAVTECDSTVGRRCHIVAERDGSFASRYVRAAERNRAITRSGLCPADCHRATIRRTTVRGSRSRTDCHVLTRRSRDAAITLGDPICAARRSCLANRDTRNCIGAHVRGGANRDAARTRSSGKRAHCDRIRTGCRRVSTVGKRTLPRRRRVDTERCCARSRSDSTPTHCRRAHTRRLRAATGRKGVQAISRNVRA
jgi:hypothetical protein